jgi:predicted hotdog family 3-hydroxylacyl-ACP dehydratase
MLVGKSAITNYIPQRAPMVMVDGLLQADENSATSVFTPGSENLFSDKGSFCEAGILENIAQTAALHAGYMAGKKGEDVKVGFIGAIKNFKVFKLPTVLEQLTTLLEIKTSMWNVTMAKGTVYLQNEIIAETELSIFLQEEKTE